MRHSRAVWWVCLLSAPTLIIAAGARPGVNSLPPGRKHLLTIEGNSTITFVPQVGLGPFMVDYRAKVEYIVNTRSAEDSAVEGESKKKGGRKSAPTASRTKKKDGGGSAAKVATTIDVSVHSSELRFRQSGQTVVESKISRSKFQGRIHPDAPVLSVSQKDAPPALLEILKSFDTTAASLFLDEDFKVVGRKVRVDGPLRALTETLLSIQTPIPRDAAFWQAPTQLAMGHGQTAKGVLLFEKQKESLVKTGGVVKVKVSGVLKAEGTVAGKFVKDGTYTVTGEQAYEPKSREWRSAKWSVAVDNELANPDGQTVAQAKGTMLVQSEALDAPVAAVTEVPATRP